ncbi:MAG: hypothetical protein JXA37_11005 [Chloroflexia bacterium]|nr:hypothetical protein [Chloroflexia bacterium]
MTDFRQRVFQARDETALKRLASKIPGIGSYMDKNLRRDADKLLRVYIADQLEQLRKRLTEYQSELLNISGGLQLMDEAEQVQKKLQLLADRLRTAVYGYAGWFDAVAIREQELDALYDYDTALLVGVDQIGEGIAEFRQAIEAEEGVKAALASLKDFLVEMHEYVDRRRDVLIGAAPPVPLTGTVETPAAPTEAEEEEVLESVPPEEGLTVDLDEQ